VTLLSDVCASVWCQMYVCARTHEAVRTPAQTHQKTNVSVYNKGKRRWRDTWPHTHTVVSSLTLTSKKHHLHILWQYI